MKSVILANGIIRRMIIGKVTSEGGPTMKYYMFYLADGDDDLEEFNSVHFFPKDWEVECCEVDGEVGWMVEWEDDE